MITVIGNAGFADYDSTTILEKINDAYHDFCSLEPWPFLEKKVDLTFDGTTGVPTNNLSDLRSVIKLADTASATILLPMRVEEHYQRHVSNLTLQGNPIFYYFVANQLNVYPIPSAVTTENNLELIYLTAETDLLSTTLSADILIPSFAHRVLVDQVISNLYLDEDDEAQSDYYLNRADRRLERVRYRLWMRNFDRSDTIEVLDEDSDFYGEIGGNDFGSYGPY